MKRAIVFLLLLATPVWGQQRDVKTSMPLPQPVPGSSGSVTLTLAEYNRLSEAATKKPKKSDAPPLPFVLSRTAFKLRVENQTVLGSVELDGSVLEKGATKVPLTNGLTVLEAKQAGNFLPLLQEGPIHAAVINGPGNFSVSLSVASALHVEAGRATLVLAVPAASSSVLSLELPGNHANVRVEPGLITNRSTLNGNTLIEATLEPGKPARLWWTTREAAAPVTQREVRFLSSVKSVVSVGDSQLRAIALCDVTVVQGDASEFKMPLPAGFELTEVTGSTLDSSEVQNGELILRVREPARRNHQFLVAIERTNRDTKAEAPVLAFSGTQHETGELLIEGIGSMELTPTESGGLRRMDVREVGAVARSLARFPLQAAFRYNRRPGDTPKLQLSWTQFPDTTVLSAIAERATVTTLTNIEGKSLTEVTLRVRNHAQPFVKVELPAGAQLLSAEVEGQRVKPVVGTDGNRVPLLRTGLNSSGAYTVSFVYLSSGDRFAKNGSYAMGLPKLDIPVNILTWEISLPDRVEVRQFGGNALAADLFPAAAQNFVAENESFEGADDATRWARNDLSSLEAGQIGGIITDPSGAVVPNAQVTVTNKQTGRTQTTRSDGDGRWVVLGAETGPVNVRVTSPGFKDTQHELELVATAPARLGTTLDVGGVSEVVTVTGSGSAVNSLSLDGLKKLETNARQAQQLYLLTPSQNVANLQRRVAGVLPVKVDVPRAGRSYKFVRPLVMDEETRVTFQYKAK
ncbi:MAG TPA: carboxypeptidase-like regulatory domain-containing protein [Pyrinomonadaceae bacterium]|nr:carboxypeptidase-like regulatory domain-containing protein [Pyrinomonadaceae bacterium]